MRYFNKYLKYKLKNQNIIGGFIKNNTANPLNADPLRDDPLRNQKIAIDYNNFVTIKDITIITDKKSIIDYYMPLPYLYETEDNFILINSKNYVLINKKKDDDFRLLQLKDGNEYQIIILNKPYPPIIEDNIIIKNIDSDTKLHNMFESIFLFKNNIILSLINYEFPDSKYKYFNILTKMLYQKSNGITIYNMSIDNFILKLIFMNKLPDIISILNKFDSIISKYNTLYNNRERHINGIKMGNCSNTSLIDCIYKFRNYEFKYDDKTKPIFTSILNNIIKEYIRVSNTVPKIEYNDSDISLILTIGNYVSDFVDECGNSLIYGYNYVCFINQYSYIYKRKQDISHKDMNKFINKNYEIIKQEFMFELLYILYILYKSNNEFTSIYKISQYLLIDYFLGCTNDEISYLPINKRQTFVSIRNIPAIDDGSDFDLAIFDDPGRVIDPNIDKYKIFLSFKKEFKYIPQTNIIRPDKTSYADCGERTLLNMFNYFLINDTGEINIKREWNLGLRRFYDKWKNIKQISNRTTLQDMKNDWGAVVEEIRELKNPDDTFYINKEYNIRPNLENIIKISKILLNIEGNVTIKDIIQNLDPTIDANDINININTDDGYVNITYKDILIQLNKNHAEFKYGLDIDTYPKFCQIYIDIILILHYENVLSSFNSDRKIYEICFLAVQLNGLDLQHVPEDKKTLEICLFAVENDGLALQYVPEDIKNSDNCLAAVKNNGHALQYVPARERNNTIYLAAIKKYSSAIQFVPENERIYEICLAAVQRDSRALQFVPRLEYVFPEERRNEIYLVAVEKNGLVLEYVPKEKRIYEICLAAVQMDSRALNYVPENERIYEICLAAVQRDSRALQFVPMLEYVFPEERRKEIYLVAVEKNGLVLRYVPEEKKTIGICLASVKNNGLALGYVPEETRKYQICLAAVKNNGLALQYVPEGIKSNSICQIAVDNDNNALQFVPVDLRQKINMT